MAELTQAARDFLDEAQLAHVVTLMKDGSPQVSPVWIDHDGTHVLFNTAEGRQKPRNIRREPRVAISIADSQNSYRYMLIRGRIVDVTTEGAWEHISRLSEKYTGNRDYPRSPEQVRLIVKVLPEHVTFNGNG